ncbi:hypothetical protein ZWY2020_041334 [Hordeum vulgare]|nr:hypothetical protein ZWY2020_041334 [Hordeum vulgare]
MARLGGQRSSLHGSTSPRPWFLVKRWIHEPPPYALARFTHFPEPRKLQSAYMVIRQQTWVAEITDRKTHKRKWLGFFHMSELAALKYEKWFTALVHLTLMAPGVVDVAMDREDREARERLAAVKDDEAYMTHLCRKHTKIMEAERVIFTKNSGEVIIISDDEAQGGEKVQGGN